MARYLKPTIVLALLVPWCWLAYRIYLETLQVGSGLGADPVEGLIHYLGEWSLIVLLSAFFDPLSRRLQWPMLIRSRRLVGVAFVFVVTHTLVFAIFYAELQWQVFLQEVIERPYITLGMASVMILTLLTVTSTRGWQRRLGRRWKQPHRWVYLAVPLALLHLLGCAGRLRRRHHLQSLGGSDGGRATAPLARWPASKTIPSNRGIG